jgi:uroporphyrinogen III methyltransferase / synthase
MTGRKSAGGEHPLEGQRVVVTRPADQAAGLVAALGDLGATVICLPTIRAVPVPAAELALVLGRLTTYDWIVFTSENGVRSFLAAIDDPLRLAGAKLAAVGHATAAALADIGRQADFVPAVALGDALLREFTAGWDLAGRRILRVRGDLAPPTLERGLRAAGALVDVATAYRTLPAAPDPAAVAEIRDNPPAAVTFASGSAVTGFASLFPDSNLPATVPAVCLGQPTQVAARRAGWRRVVVAASTSVADLARAVVLALDL